ncbi:hypothetical protein CROQUDRAFT_652956 [Cronartium quercuum f. sp. fusiforme G11]|uniref:Uncharacterized protein n=1 Tax=Cronartium quercuum f. sp. fusiforme G11 TaxID=708437 RepID=A0A9P6TGP2_9BASI|nr:hypothetical protein CROQUDRAFT_652956 [Cronartium quercuum f. sp. fusiforme G11]
MHWFKQEALLYLVAGFLVLALGPCFLVQSNRKLSGLRVPKGLENHFHQLPPLYLTLPTIYATLRKPSNRLSTTFNLPVCC